MRTKVDAKLRELEEHLEEANLSDAEKGELILAIESIRDEVRELEDRVEDADHPGLLRLNEVSQKLASSNPSLAGVINSISMALSRMGI